MNFFFVAIERFIPISSNPISSNPISSNKRCRCPISSIFFWQIMVHLLFDYPIKPLDWSLERLVEGRCSIVCQPERVFRLLQDEFFDYFNGMFPVRMWNMYALEGPRTNNHAEGWHSKVQKLAGKAHPNIYEAVTLFQSEQATTEVSIMQLAAGGL